MTDEPAIRVVGGTPTDEETAAIAAVFAQIALERAVSTLPLPTGAPRSGWALPERMLRAPLPRGIGWQQR